MSEKVKNNNIGTSLWKFDAMAAILLIKANLNPLSKL
jgi:hypothetical protein